MDVDVHDHFFVLVTTFNQLSHIEYFRLIALPTHFPFPVEVTSIS